MAAARLTVWTIYRSPDDHPGKWVLRAHDIVPHRGMHAREQGSVVAATLEEARAAVPAGLTRRAREPTDAPTIYETWSNEQPPIPGVTLQ